MGFLVSSYPETVGVKWPGRKKIFCLFSDTLVERRYLRLQLTQAQEWECLLAPSGSLYKYMHSYRSGRATVSHSELLQHAMQCNYGITVKLFFDFLVSSKHGKPCPPPLQFFNSFWVEVKNEIQVVHSLPEILIGTGPLLSDFQKRFGKHIRVHKKQRRLRRTILPSVR